MPNFLMQLEEMRIIKEKEVLRGNNNCDISKYEMFISLV